MFKKLIPGKIPASPPLPSVYLILPGYEVLFITTELVNLDVGTGQNISCYLFASAWLCGSASKWALESWC